MPRKYNRKSSYFARLQRRQKVAAGFCSGRTQQQLSKELGVTQGTICNDLKILRDEWLSMSLADFDTKVAEILGKLEHLERVAWEAFNESKLPHKQRSRKVEKALRDVRASTKLSRPTGQRLKNVTTQTITRPREGNPRYLEIVTWVIATRIKLEGLDRDQPLPVVKLEWDDLFAEAHSDVKEGQVYEQVIVDAGKPPEQLAHNGSNGTTQEPQQ